MFFFISFEFCVEFVEHLQSVCRPTNDECDKFVSFFCQLSLYTWHNYILIIVVNVFVT